MDRPPSAHVRAEARRRIEEWLDRLASDNPVVEATGADRDDPDRWFVRLAGEEKTHSTLWLSLGQRTLGHEVYVLPAPEDNPAAFYEQLLRRNPGLFGQAFGIGSEDAVYLTGRMALGHIDGDELDHMLGTVYATLEQAFGSLLRVGFATRLASEES